jgi:hypothetical protein
MAVGRGHDLLALRCDSRRRKRAPGNRLQQRDVHPVGARLLKEQPSPRKADASFLTGKTPPDFPPDNFEVNFVERGTLADLDERGRSQLGITEAVYRSTITGISA